MLQVTGPGQSDPVAIKLRARAFETVSHSLGSTRELIERFGDALELSHRTGEGVAFVVTVPPDGSPTFRPLEPPARDPAGQAGSDDLAQALAQARQRGRSRAAEVLSGDDMLSADHFAELIGTSRMTVNTKRKSNQVLGLDGAKRGFRFPEWQIGENGKPFAALPALFERLGGGPWAVYRFLVQHHPELDGLTGREALRRGKDIAVLEAADGIGHGTFG